MQPKSLSNMLKMSTHMSSKSSWQRSLDSIGLHESFIRDDSFSWNGTNSPTDGSPPSASSSSSSSENPLDGFPYPSRYGWTRIAIVSAIVTVVMLAIVVGNGLVVMAIVVDRKLKGVQNWFVASLAVSDLFVGLFIMPLSLANELLGYWAFGNVLCSLWLATDVLLCTASILNLCLISLDRYWSITCAVSYVRQRTRCRALAMISTVWVLSMAICLPPLVGWKRPQPTRYGGYPLCVLSEEPGYVVYSIVGSFYLPLVVMVSVYFKIYLAARSRARRNLDSNRLKVTAVAAAGGKETRFKSSLYSENRTKHHSAPEPCCRSDGMKSVDTDSTCRPKRENRQRMTSLSSRDVAFSSNGICIELTLTANRSFDASNSFTAEQLDSVSKKRRTQFQCDGKNQAEESVKFHRNSVESEASGPSNEIENLQTATKQVNNDLKASSSDDNDDDDELCSGDSPPFRSSPFLSQAPPRLSDSVGLSSADERTSLFPLSPKFSPIRGSRSSSADVLSSRHSLKRYYLKYSSPPNEIQEAAKARRRLARARERRATVVLGIVMASFIGCWLPFFSLYPATSLAGFQVPPELFGVIFWLGYCNSALNPFIYTIFNREFRQAFHKILFRHLAVGRSWV